MDDYQPITTVLKIKYKEGFNQECLQWMQETASVASVFEGFLEKEICVPTETDCVLINIFTFRNNKCLQAWETSEAKNEQAKKGALFIESIQSKVQMAGLEFMFSSLKSPKRWKMVVITVSVIFILLNTLVPVLQHLFTALNFPILVRSLFGVIIMVCLMTYVILPFLSKLLSRWLKI